ncbi:MAG: 2-isopropylmalate synthase [Acutalibacteraceae bacterium]|nr:2-isopropylmalate synthase [Acutalibacteraceae bacterium]HBV73860.1 2-isopropylmalate synthase [Oscillospiraceae bacterium]
MNQGYKKYKPFTPIDLPDRQWPNRVIDHAPIWCSVDLRDGNQALVDPMNLEEKLEYFKTLIAVGFKEIEVGFPSASETEYEILRTLIDGHYIPDDVTIQVLVQARPHLIKKTFEAIDGAKNVIVHFYNSTSTLQRKVVFKTDMDGVIQIAVDGARLIYELTEEEKKRHPEMNIRFEYSPESFTGTEMDNAVEICRRVMEELHITKENPIILNLPSTVEGSSPNGYADQIEYFCRHLPNRDAAIISLHPHNDRGEGVAATELALMAGADRVEGTLFGNGERTGNVDVVTLALNMWTQGVDPKLDFHNINAIREVYERCTKMQVPPRQPYAGELVFTAFSGSHQDAINKGKIYMEESGTPYWEIPYLPIDPADVGREYEPIIRINSQSGKGGTAFILANNYGIKMPKSMHPEFSAVVQKACDEKGKELKAEEVFDLFQQEYRNVCGPYRLVNYKISEEKNEQDDLTHVHFSGELKYKDNAPVQIEGNGNGPVAAFCDAMNQTEVASYQFVDYSEHAISVGSDSKAISYIHLKNPQGKDIFGIGVSHNIGYASMKGIICAINRDQADTMRDDTMPGIFEVC